MKRINQILSIAILASLLSACAGSSQPYAYDDVYYSPSNDPVRQVQKDPREDFNKTDDLGYQSYPNRYQESNSDDYSDRGYNSDYDNSYSEAERGENSQEVSGNNQTVIINNSSDGDVEYYDPEYARTVERLNRPIQSFNTYDPYLRDRILYTYDPYFYRPSIYGGYGFYDPFLPTTGLRIGWNSWSGWNIGVGIGFGYSSWACYDPFWNPWRPRWGYNAWNPWFPSYGWGYGYGWGYDPYWAGYHHGYYNGVYAGNHFGGGGIEGSGGRGRTRISTPRGSSASRSFAGAEREANRPRQNTSNARIADDNPQMNRQASPKSGREDLRQRNAEERTPTPSRYATDRSRETYSRPENTSHPKQEVRSREQVQPRPNTVPSRRQQSTRPSNTIPERNVPSSRPRTEPRQYNNNYNPSRSVRPQRTPSYQSSPSNNGSNYSRPSRPSYNRTPSYSPSRGGGSSPSRPSSRPRR